MRDRRILLGLTQQQMAELIGVAYQQAYKYEKGINRVSAGRLYTMARALGVQVSYFFEGLLDEGRPPPSGSQRLLLELTRNFLGIRDRRHQEAVILIARALAGINDGKQLPAAWPHDDYDPLTGACAHLAVSGEESAIEATTTSRTGARR
jgi:transcriptional regulator with XRE-family HTH domain